MRQYETHNATIPRQVYRHLCQPGRSATAATKVALQMILDQVVSNDSKEDCHQDWCIFLALYQLLLGPSTIFRDIFSYHNRLSTRSNQKTCNAQRVEYIGQHISVLKITKFLAIEATRIETSGLSHTISQFQRVVAMVRATIVTYRNTTQRPGVTVLDNYLLCYVNQINSVHLPFLISVHGDNARGFMQLSPRNYASNKCLCGSSLVLMTHTLMCIASQMRKQTDHLCRALHHFQQKKCKY